MTEQIEYGEWISNSDLDRITSNVRDLSDNQKHLCGDYIKPFIALIRKQENRENLSLAVSNAVTTIDLSKHGRVLIRINGNFTLFL